MICMHGARGGGGCDAVGDSLALGRVGCGTNSTNRDVF